MTPGGLRRAMGAGLVVCLCLSACGSLTPRLGRETERAGHESAARRGAYYKDDGPGDNPPANLDQIPDAQPRDEPLHRFANRPYQVFGRDYVPLQSHQEFMQRGVGSWYGRRYHGQNTSSGERYDMYAMTAAHPTLPIPSYARVTHVGNGRSVVVRINDRGPFHGDRIIDLSFVAANRLGYAQEGSALLQVQAVRPGDLTTSASSQSARAATTQITTPVAMQNWPEQRDARGVYLQLGAFAAKDNAEAFRVRINQQAPWLSEQLQIVPQAALFRLQAGPYATSEAARAIADQLRNELNLNSVLVKR